VPGVRFGAEAEAFHQETRDRDTEEQYQHDVIPYDRDHLLALENVPPQVRQHDAGDEGDAGDIEHEGISEVKIALEVMDKPVIDRGEDGSNEENDETPHDAHVRNAAEDIPLEDRYIEENATDYESPVETGSPLFKPARAPESIASVATEEKNGDCQACKRIENIVIADIPEYLPVRLHSLPLSRVKARVF
jgi:hypothetical protein